MSLFKSAAWSFFLGGYLAPQAFAANSIGTPGIRAERPGLAGQLPKIALNLNAQILALTPLAASPQSMAQALTQSLIGPEVTQAQAAAAALLIEAIERPEALPAVQELFGGIRLDAGLPPVGTEVNDHLQAFLRPFQDNPKARAAFAATIEPLSQQLTSIGLSIDSPEGMKAALDGFFTGENPAGALADPAASVLAQSGRPAGHDGKIRLALARSTPRDAQAAVPEPVPPPWSGEKALRPADPDGKAEDRRILEGAGAKDYYRVLGVERTASGDEIKRAFWRLRSKYHPDKNRGSREQERQYAAVFEAYAAFSGSNSNHRAPPPPRPEDEFVTMDDPFVRRFRLELYALNPYRRAILSKERKALFEAYVLEQERLYAANQPEDILKHHDSVADPLDDDFYGVALEIFFTIIGENAKKSATRPIADQVLKGFALSREKLEHLETSLDWHGDFRRLGEDATLPKLYPAAIEAVLSSVRSDGFDKNPNGRPILSKLMNSDAVKRYPAFYEKIAEHNPLLWNTLAIRLVELVSDEDELPAKGKKLPAEIRRLIRVLKNRGADVDRARLTLIDNIAAHRSELLDYADLIEEALKIKDYSSFEGFFDATLFEERASEKKDLLDRFLGAMAKEAPEVLVGGLEGFEARLIKNVRRARFKEVAAYLDPFYAQARRNMGRKARKESLLSIASGT